MKIDRNWWVVGVFAFIIILTVILTTLYLGNKPSNSFDKGYIWGVLIVFSFVALLIIVFLFSSEKIGEEKTKHYVGQVAFVLLIIAGGNILGFKLNTIWEYLIAFVLLYVFYEYILVKIYSWIRQKTMRLHINVEHNMSKRLKKKYNN
jgi:hypothetical protein